LAFRGPAQRLALRLACVLALHAGSAGVLSASASAATRAARPRGANVRTGRATPPLSELVKAARKNDRAALERVSARLGVSRLGEALRSSDAAVAQAALAGIPLVRGGVLLSAEVAERLKSSDPSLAIAAARALGALLDGHVATELGEWEVPADVIARACGGLRVLAARADAGLPPRLAALDALALGQTTCAPGGELAGLMRDPAPAVRRAAATLLRPDDRQAAAALHDGMADPDRAVAAACVATVCRRVDPAVPRRKGDALFEQATVAARNLVAAAGTPPEDAVEMLACVAAAGTPADRALLDKLRQGPASAVRDRAGELAGALAGAAPGKPE
jgi:hypothetical protein